MTEGGAAVIAATLNDSELRSAITALAQAVDKQTKEMAQAFDTAVTRMTDSLGKFVQGLQTGVGATQKAVADNKKTEESVLSLANSYDKLAQSMSKSASNSGGGNADALIASYDKLVGQLQYAQREVTMLGNRKSLNVDDINRYEEALKRVADLRKQIDEKQSKLAMLGAQRNEKLGAFDAQAVVRSFDMVDARLKQLNAHYKQLEAQSRKTFAHELTAAMKMSEVGIEKLRSKWLELERLITIGKGNDFITPEQLAKAEEMRDRIRRLYQEMQRLKEANSQQTQSKKLGWDQISVGEWEAKEQARLEKLRREIAAMTPEQRALYQATQQAQEAQARQRIEAAKSKPIYTDLNAELKSLKEAWQKLAGSEQLGTPRAKQLADDIQRIQRELQQIQGQMSRPVSLKKALGLDESTLDNISYKLRQLQSYRSGLNLQTEASEIRQVTAEIQRLQNKQRDLMASNNQLARSNDNVTKTFDYIKRRFIYLASVGGATNFVKNLIEVRGQYELTERALGILVDSAQKGSQIFHELSDMALISPYTLIELSNAARQLTAYGVAAKDVVDTTRRLADIAAAVGAPLQNIAYALGHVQSYGYLTSLQARQFANNGIPLVKALAERYTELEGKMVSVTDVYARMKKKQVEYADVMEVITRMTDEGGRFFDFQAKSAQTLKIQLANLTLAWNNMLNDIGKQNQTLLAAPIEGLKTLFANWQSLSKIITDVVVAFGSFKAMQLLLQAAIGKTTLKELAQKLALKETTAASYAATIKTAGLTETQMKYLLAVNKTNAGLKAAAVSTKLLSVEQANAATSAGIFRTSLYALGASIGVVNQVASKLAVGLASLFANPALWAGVAVMAIVDVVQSFKQAEEAVNNYNSALQKNAKEMADSIGEYTSYLKKLDTSTLDENTLAKEWERMCEEIQNATELGQQYIAKLSQIEDISKRLSAGEALMGDIEKAQSLLSQLGDNAIRFDAGFKVLGVGVDSLAENLADLSKAQNNANDSMLNFSSEKYRKEIESASNVTNEILRQFDKFKNLTLVGLLTPNVASPDHREIDKLAYETRETQIQVSEFVGSIAEQITRQNVSNVREMREMMEQAIKTYAAEQNLSTQQTLNLRIMAEETFYREYIANSKKMSDEQKANFRDTFEMGSASANAFLEYLSTRHKHTFTSITQEELDNNKWINDERKEALKETLKLFYKNNRLAYENLVSYVNMANLLRIQIPVFFQVSADAFSTDFQKDFQKRFHDRFPKVDIKNLHTTYEAIEEWRKQEDALAKSVKATNDAIKKGANLSSDAEEKERKELEELIHAYGGLTKAEENAAKKSGRGKHGRKAEDELAKALKEEIQLINQMRGNYSKLRKVGYDAITSLEVASSGYENTLKRINSILGKFGVAQFNASDFVGKDAQDPNTLLDFLKKQLNSLKGNKNVKTASLKDLEVEIGKLDIDVKEYNMKKVTEGLQKELTKVKDEYELAVELDTNPELADIFTNMFGIDTSAMSSKIEDVIDKYNELAKNAVLDSMMPNMDITDRDRDVFDLVMGDFDLLQTDLVEWAKETGVAIDSELYKGLENYQKELRNMVKKYEQDLVKQTKDLEYKLADRNGKIIIEEKKLTLLRERLAKETREKEKHLLELQVQDQINVIERLKEEILSELPTYKALFNSIVEHSDMVTRRLAKNYIKMLQDAKDKGINDRGMFEVIDPINGKKTELKPEKLFKEEDKGYEQLRKSSTIFAKIKESFKKGEDGIIDWAKGLEYVNELAQQCGGAFHDVANILSEMGADAGLVDVVNALGDTMEGLGTAMQGASQIASGDYIGGAMSVVKGLWQTVSSWFDVKDKKIQRQIEESEKRVKELERTYAKLEHEINKALGAEEIKAEKAAIANKKAQLAELQRQLQLEKSRSKKKQDADKIDSLQDEIQSLQFEIEDAVEDITNNLLGSNIKNAAEDFVNTWVSAWKEGGDVMDALNGKFDDMIENMIMKSIASKVVAKKLQPIWDIIDQITGEENDVLMLQTLSRIKNFMQNGNFAESISTALKYIYEYLGIGYGSGNNKELSALQQGIQGITEDQAGALEAYWNANTQQQYVQSDLLTQIRDAVVGMNPDVNLATSAEILLQLQQSYQIQSTIQSMLAGWSNPSGSAVKVELIS